jgi:N-acetylated-alpha-linked acidic dipeptidase
MVASPSFAHLVRETAKRVPHPQIYDRTLWDARTDRGKLYGNLSDDAIALMNAEMDAEITNDELSNIRPLGSGSDFTVFLQRIGVRLLHKSCPYFRS